MDRGDGKSESGLPTTRVLQTEHSEYTGSSLVRAVPGSNKRNRVSGLYNGSEVSDNSFFILTFGNRELCLTYTDKVSVCKQ